LSKTTPVDLPASVRQRLLNLSRYRGEDFNFVLTRYAVERLLYRITRSEYASQFILKGASLIAVWTGRELRPTRDVDLLGLGDSSDEWIIQVFQHICSVDVEPDGLQFNPEIIGVEDIREGQAYGGQRVRLLANLGNARITVQIDIGFGDPVTPEAKEITYPTLLDFPAPRILAYPPESVVAGKLEALVSLGMVTTRMKDIYDLRLMARLLTFESSTLIDAIRATFNSRDTEIPTTTPTALSAEFVKDEDKPKQWAAFLIRSGLEKPDIELIEVIGELRSFLVLPLEAAATGAEFVKSWRHGGPWT